LTPRRNDYDVTNRVNTTDPASVNGEVNRIFFELYPNASTHVINRCFRDLTRLQAGEYPGYHACDTEYHNLQHSLDVTLAMARLMASTMTAAGLLQFAAKFATRCSSPNSSSSELHASVTPSV